MALPIEVSDPTGSIDGWSSLAQAKADLRDWLPLILAGLAWTAVEGIPIQQGK